MWYAVSVLSMLCLSIDAEFYNQRRLTDEGLVPFQACYLVIYVLIVALLVGNHALPIMLRFIIWIGTKITRNGVKHESLHFLLDHPRR